MKRKAFMRYVQQNPELTRWLMNNRDWIAENPQTMRLLIQRWYAMSSPKGRAGMRRGSSSHTPKIGKLPKMDVGKISEATEQLMRTLDMFENMRNIASIFNLR